MTKIEQIQTILGDIKVDNKWGPNSQASLDRLAHGVALHPVPKDQTGFVIPVGSENVISTLHPVMQPIVRQMLQLASKDGMDVRALSGTRSYAEQDAIFNRHDNTTKARGGYSNHNFSIACDFGIFVGGKYIDDEVDKHRFSGAEMERLYTQLSVIGKSLGLSWGGDWDDFQDQPHFELHPAWAKDMDEKTMLARLRLRHDKGIDVFA